jgi:lipoprotein-anchoring transpeptidase ErfK/SrfK
LPRGGASSRRRWLRLAAFVALAGVTIATTSLALGLHRQHARAASASGVVSGITAAVSSRAVVAALSGAPAAGLAGASTDASSSSPQAGAGTHVTATASQPLALTARDRTACPASATACVDLAEKITWLQSRGQVRYGPVRMEPGTPGTSDATPAGTFSVAWKAGPAYISTSYHEPIPWAVFFAPGGVAFHAGSLASSSHGCVHLTLTDARYYNAHLPVGARVVVF